MMKTNYSKNQRGVVTVLVVMALPVLLLIMGLALDFGHVFVNKTRLQNALDATALSAAIAINGDINKNKGNATAAGQDTFKKFIAASGNGELLKNLKETDLTFEYSKTLDDAAFTANNTAPPTFVRVKSIGMLNVTPVLIRISGDMPIPAIATAGAVGNNCSLVPFVICTAIPVDKDCSDNACYGYSIGQIISLIRACNGSNASCPPNSLESGNYGLLNLDGMNGGRDIKCVLAPAAKGCNDPGYRNTCTTGGTNTALETKAGYTWGDVSKGIDDRFDSDTQTTQYHNYDKSGNLNSYNPSPYNQYMASKSGNNNRVMAVPIGDCSGLQNGQTELPKVGTACLFLTEYVIANDKNTGKKKEVMAEFTGKTCEQNGIWDPQNAVLNGPYKIVLFKSPASGDS